MSTAKEADELIRQGFKITDDTVGRTLKSLRYLLQGTAKGKRVLLTQTEIASSTTSTNR